MLNINNTLDSYLQNVEIKGNTIQNPNDLSDIKSVGDKIDDQEVYRIPIVCTNGLDKSSSDYKEHKITILSPTPIEKVGNVTDRIIEKDGVWGVEKNIITEIFNGSESWMNAWDSNGNTIGFYVTRNNGGGHIICDKFKSTSGNIATLDEECITFPKNAWIGVRINKSKLETANITGFKKFLTINNIMVKYPTAKPKFIPLPHAQQVKLKTFANKTNISFLTEIEGTIKADVAKSRSASVNSNTQEIGKINNRILDLEGLKESQEMGYETDKGYLVCKETKVGTVKDMKVYGRSLVNICKKRRFTAIGNGSGLVSDIGSLAYPIENEIDFTVIVKVPSDLPNKNCFFRGYDQNGSGKVNIFDGDELYNNRGKILVKKVTNHLNFETPTVNIRLFADRTASEGDSFSVDDVMVLIGDHTQNPPPFFEGIASVGTDVDKIEVSSYGKNLLDISRPIIDEKNRYGYFELPKTNNNVTISLKDKDSSLPLGNAYLGLTKTGVDAGNGNEITWIISNGELTNSYPKNYNYVSFFPNNMETLNLILKRFDIMVNLGDIAIPYEPYKGDKKPLLFKDADNTWKPIPKLCGKWENGKQLWGDVVDSVKGKWHNRCNEYVINGNESGLIINTTFTNDNNITVQFRLEGAKYLSDIISDKLNVVKINGQNIGLSIAYNDYIYITMPKSIVGNDLQSVKTYLQTNNITVIYQLAEEKVFEVNPLFLEAYENETMILCESGAVKPGMEWKITSYITNLVSTNTKRIKRIENDFYNYTVSQNRMMLSSRYNADRADFRIDNTLGVPKTVSVELDYDLFELMKKVVIIGKDNYDRSKIEEQMDFYVTEGFIDWDMWDELFAIIELQHNPPVDLIPIEPISIEEPKPKKSRRGRKKS